jgi:hypothetical protein
VDTGFFSGKKILILSPQPWNYFYISKHHYAMELARKNQVWFMSSPETGIGWKLQERKIAEDRELRLIDYKIPVQASLRFHAKPLYKLIHRLAVRKLLDKLAPEFDICIDFGCYAFFDSIRFIKARKKIFFPVDNFGHIPFSTRGSDYIFTVSQVIQEKFRAQGLKCHFVNHGLSEAFAKVATGKLAGSLKWNRGERIKVGYSGNLFIRFLDTVVFRKIIADNPFVEFHLFGSLSHNEQDEGQSDWYRFLTSCSNVVLHGFQQPTELAFALDQMDVLLLCYKPDNKDYFGENTHKMIEYLSVGKAIVSTHITLYKDSELINMTGADENLNLPKLFNETIANLEHLNCEELMKRRILFALDNTYQKQIERIEEIMAKQ